ncbi:hypothetical protein H2204_005116 [Knufia peltigerae]|uniref:Uncharacterized protein n=1 Tax=Knufia peltigerae TaxID=1002370 RepID=A0AA38Y7Q0_9EURO|nr:hypothetical protein H2204_005116 [Knufia peltigerae]
MNLLEHGLSMERKDFLNLHRSLAQNMAFEYSLEQLRGPRSETTGQLVSSPADHPKSKPASGKSLSTEYQRGGKYQAPETTSSEISPTKKRKAEDDSSTVPRRRRTMIPRITDRPALSRPAIPTQATEVEPAKALTTILRTKFGARLQRESTFLPGAEVFQRRRRMCALYGQGLIDALQAEQNHKDDFNTRLHETVRSVYTFSQQQHDRNGNKYNLIELAAYLSGQLGLPLTLYLETAEMASRVTTDWTNLYTLYVKTQVQIWYNLRARVGRPFQDNPRARHDVFESLWSSETVSGKFFDALRSLWLKVNAQGIL